jgi:hypothetical protein
MSVMDDVGRNLLEHACLTGDWNLVTWALQIGCWLSPKGAQGLVSALQQSKLGASFKVSKASGGSIVAGTCRNLTHEHCW